MDTKHTEGLVAAGLRAELELDPSEVSPIWSSTGQADLKSAGSIKHSKSPGSLYSS